MIEAVFLFGFVSALFEIVVLMKLKPRTRLKLLGSKPRTLLTHTIVFALNIVVHYGTVTGSMAAIVASLSSFACLPLVRWCTGYIENGYYYPGSLIRYTGEQLK